MIDEEQLQSMSKDELIGRIYELNDLLDKAIELGHQAADLLKQEQQKRKELEVLCAKALNGQLATLDEANAVLKEQIKERQMQRDMAILSHNVDMAVACLKGSL